MGNSRTLLVTAISAILGLYALGIKKADQKSHTIPMAQVHKMQAKEISKAGLGMGLSKLVKERQWSDRARGKPMLEGTLDYYVINYSYFGWNWAYIQATGTYKNETVTRYAWAQEIKKNKWKVVRHYAVSTTLQD